MMADDCRAPRYRRAALQFTKAGVRDFGARVPEMENAIQRRIGLIEGPMHPFADRVPEYKSPVNGLQERGNSPYLTTVQGVP